MSLEIRIQGLGFRVWGSRGFSDSRDWKVLGAGPVVGGGIGIDRGPKP